MGTEPLLRVASIDIDGLFGRYDHRVALNHRRLMTLYVRDMAAKLEVLLPLAERIGLFIDIVNAKLVDKHTRVDRTAGTVAGSFLLVEGDDDHRFWRRRKAQTVPVPGLERCASRPTPPRNTAPIPDCPSD